MQSPSHVFISFKTEERDKAFQLKEALNKAGYLVWWQETIQCGQEWHGEIDKAIESAGAIVVLWSPGSMASPWVRHEASQAMVRKVYTPVRLQPMEIESPYNRVQATDIDRWNGDTQHPGFLNLLARLKELMPPAIPVWKQARDYAWQRRASILLFVIAGVALWMLFTQSKILNKQIGTQQATFKNVQDQSKALQSQGTVLDAQLKQQETALENSRRQSQAMDSQFQSQSLFAQRNLQRLAGVTQNLDDVTQNLFNVEYPLMPLKMRFNMIYILNQKCVDKVTDWAWQKIQQGKNKNLTSNAFLYSKDIRGGRQTVEELAQSETDLFDSVAIGIFDVSVSFYKKELLHSPPDSRLADAIYSGVGRVQNINFVDFDISKFGDHRVTEEAELELQLTTKMEDIQNLKQLDADTMIVTITPMRVGEGRIQNNIFKEDDFIHRFSMELYFGADPVPKFSVTYDLLPSYPDNKNDANLPKRKKIFKDVKATEFVIKQKFVLNSLN